jgi:hypothetical protein
MKRIAYAFSLAAMAGCAFMRGGAHESAPPAQVSEADFSRLAPDEMGPVNEAREYLASAREEQGRAKLRQQDTMHEADLAKADQQAAYSDEQRAVTQAKMANDSREPAQLEQARQFQELARLHKSEAEAHAQYAAKLAEARKADVQSAEDQVALGEAKLEWAKLQAMQQANVPAAGKYDPTGFQARVDNAKKKCDHSLQTASDLEGQASSLKQLWQDLQQQLQAHGNATETG